MPAGFIVQGAAWNEDDSAFDIFVHNGIGQRVTDFQLEIQGCDLSNSVSISPGNTERITVPCNTITPNARFNSDIRVNYKTITDGHTLDRTGIGRISMDVGVVGDILVCNDNLEFHAGIGNEENPYQICNWFHLNNTRTYLSAHYVLVSNLGPSTPGYDGLGDDWEPIGASFIGTFDGMGNLISDLVIELGTNYYGGLFRSIGESGEVRNIGLVDVDIKADMRVGGIAGHSSGIISNSFTTGLVSGFSEGSEEAAQVGGLTGTNTGIINNSYSKADVEGIWGIGGL
ncbi:MAG: hypothetical protein ACMXX5_01335, partial [Candidatus Woesearchaeota archaeon]